MKTVDEILAEQIATARAAGLEYQGREDGEDDTTYIYDPDEDD